MADSYDRTPRDNDRSDNRGPRQDRGGFRRKSEGGESRDRGGYRGGSSDRPREDRGSRGDRNDRGGSYGDNRNRDGMRSDKPREDRRGGDRPYSRDDRGERGDRREAPRGGRGYSSERPGRTEGQNRGGYGERSERRYEKRDDRGGRPTGGRDAQRGHANRGGREQSRDRVGPQRAGFREERLNTRMNEPDLPGDIDVKDLDPLVLQDLRVLSKDNADAVAKHMIMAATWLADDPKLALRHARAAKDRAGRVSVVRETNGIVAYHAEEWKEALSELRAARRMSGGPGLIAVMADCERGLGRPEKAIDLARTEDLTDLSSEDSIELAIVVAGARHDLGQHDAAVIELQRVNPSLTATGMTASRLSYAYADALVLAGRADESREWFQHADDLDEDGFLDAAQRIEQLDKGNN